MSMYKGYPETGRLGHYAKPAINLPILGSLLPRYLNQVRWTERGLRSNRRNRKPEAIKRAEDCAAHHYRLIWKGLKELFESGEAIEHIACLHRLRALERKARDRTNGLSSDETGERDELYAYFGDLFGPFNSSRKQQRRRELPVWG